MAGRGRVVCVTGAGGFAASWLVKLLLQKGFTVHGTVRDPDNEKNAHLRKLEHATENLQLLKADLLNYDSLMAAIAGCEGVFHTACPVPPNKVSNPEIEMIPPALDGTLNVLKACFEAKVQRVVVVSSVSAIIMNPKWPHDKIMDEQCWSDKEFCRTTENWYCFSKTIAEEKALEYSKESGLDVITICPSLIIGPMLQPTLNASSQFLVKILTGKRKFMENRFLHLVDVRDLADALLLAYEKAEVGRYICSSHAIKACDFINKLSCMYPNYKYLNNFTEVDRYNVLSLEKLKQLGWKYRPLEVSIKDSVEHFQKTGIVN